MLTKKKKFLILGGVLLAVLIFLDLDYFIAQLKFEFSDYKDIYPSNVSSDPSIVEKMSPNQLIIGSLGIAAPIVYVNEKSEKAYQAALINGVVHYPGTADPGQLGNSYIFGHSSDFFWSQGHYKNIFATLPKIHIGDSVVISDPDGNKFVYIVTDSRKVAATDLSVLDQQGYRKKLLTLQTSYPVGTALARWVVVAEIKNP